MFSFFKKKKKDTEALPHYNPTNIRVEDLRKGFLVDYNLQTWEVAEEFEYDWGNEYFTYEYKLSSVSDTCYLSVEEENGQILCQVVRKINFAKIDDNISATVASTGKPPRSIELNGVVFYRGKESPGYFRNLEDEDWEEFICWDYTDDAGKMLLCIEQWDDNEFEAYLGQTEPEKAFSNILPAHSS